MIDKTSQKADNTVFFFGHEKTVCPQTKFRKYEGTSEYLITCCLVLCIQFVSGADEVTGRFFGVDPKDAKFDKQVRIRKMICPVAVQGGKCSLKHTCSFCSDMHVFFRSNKI